MKKTLYVMRHAETINNVRNIVQGRCDSDLTEKGIEETKLVKNKWFSNTKIDHIYCSPIGRARKTVEILTDRTYEVVEGLTERYQGEREGQKFIDIKGVDDYARMFNGELKDDFRKRIKDTMDEIMNKDNEKVLVVTHGALCSHFRNMVLSEDVGSWIDNCSIFKYEWEDGRYSYIKEYKVSEM